MEVVAGPYPDGGRLDASVSPGDAAGHDLDHAWKVFLLGMRSADETGTDEAVIQPAALTHDLHRIMGAPGDSVHPTDSVSEVREVFERADTPREPST